MNSKQRIDAVVAGEIPDRVPVAPLLDHFAATYTGVTHAALMSSSRTRLAAVLRTMRELGPWDMTFAGELANPTLLRLGIPRACGCPAKIFPPTRSTSSRNWSCSVRTTTTSS